MAYSKTKLKSSDDRASPCFRPFWIEKTIRQMFTYMDFTICFIQTHFNEPENFHGHPKLYENIVQFFPPH
jgi:hypothetical protein